MACDFTQPHVVAECTVPATAKCWCRQWDLVRGWEQGGWRGPSHVVFDEPHSVAYWLPKWAGVDQAELASIAKYRVDELW